MEVQAELPFITVDLSLLLVAITLVFVASFLLQLIDATAINPPLPTVEIALSDGPRAVLEGKLLTHTEGPSTSLMSNTNSHLCPIAR